MSSKITTIVALAAIAAFVLLAAVALTGARSSFNHLSEDGSPSRKLADEGTSNVANDCYGFTGAFGVDPNQPGLQWAGGIYTTPEQPGYTDSTYIILNCYPQASSTQAGIEGTLIFAPYISYTFVGTLDPATGMMFLNRPSYFRGSFLSGGYDNAGQLQLSVSRSGLGIGASPDIPAETERIYEYAFTSSASNSRSLAVGKYPPMTPLKAFSNSVFSCEGSTVFDILARSADAFTVFADRSNSFYCDSYLSDTGLQDTSIGCFLPNGYVSSYHLAGGEVVAGTAAGNLHGLVNLVTGNVQLTSNDFPVGFESISFLNVQANLEVDGSGIIFGYAPEITWSFVSYIPPLAGGPEVKTQFPFKSCGSIAGWYNAPGVIVANACGETDETKWRGADIQMLFTCSTCDGCGPDDPFANLTKVDQEILELNRIVINGEMFDTRWRGTFHYSGAFQVVAPSADPLGDWFGGDKRITGKFQRTGGFNGALATLAGEETDSNDQCGQTALLSGERFDNAQ
jgi:hypothetical protein